MTLDCFSTARVHEVIDYFVFVIQIDTASKFFTMIHEDLERRSDHAERRSDDDRRSDHGDRRSDYGDRRSDYGDRRSDYGDRRSEFGGKWDRY